MVAAEVDLGGAFSARAATADGDDDWEGGEEGTAAAVVGEPTGVAGPVARAEGEDGWVTLAGEATEANEAAAVPGESGGAAAATPLQACLWRVATLPLCSSSTAAWAASLMVTK